MKKERNCAKVKIPKKERWLFDLKNKEIVEELKEAFKQKVGKKIDLSLFEEK